MSPGVASFSPSQRRGALGALIRCLRSQGSGSDWGHRETARVFQYVWCLSCNQAAKASPCGACLSGTLPDVELSGRQPPAGPTLLGVQGLGAGGARAMGLQQLFLGTQGLRSRGEVQGKQPHEMPVRQPQRFTVRMRLREGGSDSATEPAGSWHQSKRECNSGSSQGQKRRGHFFLFHLTL